MTAQGNALGLDLIFWHAPWRGAGCPRCLNRLQEIWSILSSAPRTANPSSHRQRRTLL